MAKKEYREIVTKAVVGKGSKSFETTHSIKVGDSPTTILGLWVINHNFSGKKVGDFSVVDGSFDVNIWYSCNNNSETNVASDKVSYNEKIDITMTGDDYDGETDVIVRAVKGPVCVNATIDGDVINYTIEKTISCEIVGDTKIRVSIDDSFETEEEKKEEPILENEEEIKNSINDDFLK